MANGEWGWELCDLCPLIVTFANGGCAEGGSVSAPGIVFDPCSTGDLLGGALSAVRAQCNYLDI